VKRNRWLGLDMGMRYFRHPECGIRPRPAAIRFPSKTAGRFVVDHFAFAALVIRAGTHGKDPQVQAGGIEQQAEYQGHAGQQMARQAHDEQGVEGSQQKTIRMRRFRVLVRGHGLL